MNLFGDLAPSIEGIDPVKAFASYSADTIGMNPKASTVRKPAPCNGDLWVSTGTGGGLYLDKDARSCELYRLVALSDFDGTPTTYAEKTNRGGGDGAQEARDDPNGFYHGMTVRSGGRSYVMAGPSLTLVLRGAEREAFEVEERKRWAREAESEDVAEDEDAGALFDGDEDEGADYAACSDCGGDLSHTTTATETECGTFCPECFEGHCEGCAICGAEYAGEETALPGFEHVDAEQADAAALARAEALTATLGAALDSITTTTGEMERLAPLFRESSANPQLSLF